MNTLGDRDDDDTSLGGLFEEIENVGTIRRHVAGAVALEDHTLDGRVEKVGHGVAADRGEEAEEHHVAVEGRVHAELHGNFFFLVLDFGRRCSVVLVAIISP